MNFEEKTIQRKTIFQGKIIDLYLDDVELPNGKTSIREIVKHPGAVAVIAITDEEKMILVEQFRKPMERTLVEIPAGKLEKGEEPINSARRELEEETGYTCKTLTHLVSFYTSPGFSDELLHVYLAEGLVKNGQLHTDEDEFVRLMEVSLPEALELVKEQKIMDAKTVYAVLYWQFMKQMG